MAIELGLIDLPLEAVGYDEVVRQLADVDARAKSLGSRTIAIGISAPSATQVSEALAGVATAEARAAQESRVVAEALAATTTQTQQSAQAANSVTAAWERAGQALGNLIAKSRAGSLGPAGTTPDPARPSAPAQAPDIRPALTALETLEAEKARVSAKPVTTPVTPPDTGPTNAALGELEKEKSQLGTPVATTVRPPDISPAVAAIGELEAEKRRAQAPVVIPISPPDVAPATEALAGLETEKAKMSASPVSVPVAPPNVAPSVEALAGLEAEKQRVSGTPVVTPVTPPNVGPAVAQITALAEAEAVQAERAAGLAAALTAAANTSATAAERATTLRAALDQDDASTAALSDATRQLDRVQRDGIEVMQLRTRAVNELIVAQEALARSQSTGARVRAEPLPVGGIPAVTVGPQLGPATPDAEAFARRTAATNAAFESQALAAAKARAEIEAYEENARRAGATTERLSPRLRSAANGLTALAFAATAGGDSFQSMALAAGLTASSLADAFGSPKLAAIASGIGAVVVVATAIVGIFERMTDSASHAATAVDEVTRSIQGIKSVNEARAAAEVAARNLARAEQELAEAKAKANQPTGAGIFDAAALTADLFRLRTLQKEVDQFRDIQKAATHQVAATEVAEANEAQQARIRIITEGTAATNAALVAQNQAFLAGEAAKFALGQTSLDDFFAARLRSIAQNTAREIAALRQRNALLAEPVADATPAQSAERAAEIQRNNTKITELEARARQQSTETMQQRQQQREALDRQILQFEQKEQDAAGDASEARIAMAKREGVEIARALVQHSGAVGPEATAAAWTAANETAQKYLATQTRLINLQKEQKAAQQIFNELDVTRAGINQLLERGLITQAEANDRIAAAERAQIPVLDEVLKRARAIAESLGNKDLVTQIDRATQAMSQLGQAPLGPLAQRLKAIQDELSVAAAEGDKWAAGLLKEIQQDIDKNGGNVSIGIVVEADWKAHIKKQIEEQGALLSILIKPKNIVLSGVEGALQQLNQNLAGLALGIGNTIGSALSEGFAAAFTKGSDKNFAEAAGNALLKGVGSLLVQLGSSMVAYAAIMAVAAPLLAFTPWAHLAFSAPAAAIAGTGLIALGAGMGGIAANNSGHRTGGGSRSSGAATAAAQDETFRVVFDPDRRLREAQPGTFAGSGVSRTVVAPASVVPQRPPTPVQQFFTIIGPNDPSVQRTISDITVAAANRGLPVGGTGRRG